MKAQEKELIYNLLKTADAYNSGYTRECFAQERVFEDDAEGYEKARVWAENVVRSIDETFAEYSKDSLISSRLADIFLSDNISTESKQGITEYVNAKLQNISDGMKDFLSSSRTEFLIEAEKRL